MFSNAIGFLSHWPEYNKVCKGALFQWDDLFFLINSLPWRKKTLQFKDEVPVIVMIHVGLENKLVANNIARPEYNKVCKGALFQWDDLFFLINSLPWRKKTLQFKDEVPVIVMIHVGLENKLAANNIAKGSNDQEK